MIFYARCDGVLGLVYLEFWLKSICEDSFLVHLFVLKKVLLSS